MNVRQFHLARIGLSVITVLWLCVVVPLSATAAPYAAMVIDARTGEVLHSRNADTRLHPASLTKMMTLYIAFEAIRNGEITLDTRVRISSNAAAEPPSKLGLRAGQQIELRYLIRAAAIRSANDAATAIGEALEGSEAAFARRMTRTAQAMGMSRTTFRNAHGLTASGHLSTARDMTTLGRHILYDYPQYYNLFSRTTANAGIATVRNTNRRLLANYRGADGIKTGYTRAAGFNLVASAERRNERIIATVFGGRSTATRNARVAELLDMGFQRAPSRARVRAPRRPTYRGSGGSGNRGGSQAPGRSASAAPVVTAVQASLRPAMRPVQEPDPVIVAEAQADEDTIRTNVNEALALVHQATPADALVTGAASSAPPVRPTAFAALAPSQTAPEPEDAPQVAASETAAAQEDPVIELANLQQETTQGTAQAPGIRPSARPAGLVETHAQIVQASATPAESPRPEVVTRLSSSGGHQWGINIGRYQSRHQAERALLTTALTEMATLDGTLRKVQHGAQGYDATFLGMTRDTADLACRRLQARNVTCFMVGPS